MKSILIDIDNLKFVKAATSVKDLELWADILIPNFAFPIAGTEKRFYSIFTEYELKILYSNTVGFDCTQYKPESYNKLLNGVVDLGNQLPIDNTSIEDLEKQLNSIPKKEAKKQQTEFIPKGPSKKGSVISTVWEICTQMQDKSRKEIIEYCISKGINKSTAATQYSKWKKAHISS